MKSRLLNDWSFQQLIEELQYLVEQFDNEPLLVEPNRLRQRLEALDLLDAYFPDIPQLTAGVEAEHYRRARAIRVRLEAANCELYETIRSEIRRGSGPDTLLRWVPAASEVGESIESASGMGYDYLDELISEVFQFEEPDAGNAPIEPEMVFYQPTPARHIFNLISMTSLTANDVLVDLGSGLGHVPLLASICTRASSIGIELEASYVECARQCAQTLNLESVAFLEQDVREADLSKGTVFYLYTPFTGSILRCVLNLLRREAGTRRIRVCTYGPCASVVAGEPWLETTAVPAADRMTVFSSHE